MLTLPCTVGPYTLHRKLGAGGITESYLAHTHGDTTNVLVRRVLPAVIRDPQRAAATEARVRDLMGIRHPFLAPVLDWLEHGNERFIVQEYVPGVSLAQVLSWCRGDNRPIPPAVFLTIATQVCNALEALHGRPASASGEPQVLHLGLRPEAVVLTEAGKVVLASFGLVRSPTLLPTGGIAAPSPGQLRYLSPEQTLADGELSPASDIFSLGSMLYELATSSVLFDAGSNLRTIHAVRRAEVEAALGQVRHRIPGLDRILARALAQSPRYRYARAFVLREDLRGLMAGYSFSTIHDDVRDFVAPLFSGAPPRAPVPAQAGDTLHAENALEVGLFEDTRRSAAPPPLVTNSVPIHQAPTLPPPALDEEPPAAGDLASNPWPDISATVPDPTPEPPRSAPPVDDRTSDIWLTPEELAQQEAAAQGGSFDRPLTEEFGLHHRLDAALQPDEESDPFELPSPTALPEPPPRPPAAPPNDTAFHARPLPPPPASPNDTAFHARPLPPAPAAPPPAPPAAAPTPAAAPNDTAFHARPLPPPPASPAPQDGSSLDLYEAPPAPPAAPPPAPKPVAVPSIADRATPPVQAAPVGPPLTDRAPPPASTPSRPPVFDPQSTDLPEERKGLSPVLIVGAAMAALALLVCGGAGVYFTQDTDSSAVVAAPSPGDEAEPVVAAPPPEPEPITDTGGEEAPPSDDGTTVADVAEPEPAPKPAPKPAAKPRSQRSRPARSAPPPALPRRAPPPLPPPPEPEPEPEEDGTTDADSRTAPVDLDTARRTAPRGTMPASVRSDLEGLPIDHPDFTRARTLLAIDADARGDASGAERHYAATMTLPENRYNPVLLSELARLQVNRRRYSSALDHARTADKHWARIPSARMFDTRATIFEAQAAATQGLLYLSEDDREQLTLADEAIRMWGRYREHVQAGSRADLVASADQQLDKLRAIRARLE